MKVKELLSLIFTRFFVFGVALLMQVCWFLLGITALSQYNELFSTALGLLSLLVVIIIINGNSKLPYKLAWIVPILLFPLLGGVLYLISGGKAPKKMLRKAFRDLPRGELDYDIGTDIRMNTVESKARLFTEELAVTQGKLSMGFRLGEIMDDPDYAALYVLNALYGGSVTSKLFMNVREKLSLCYYASSMCDVNKGVMFVYSGIDFDKYDAAYNEILAQLDAVKNGDFTEEELDAARQAVAAELRTYMDSERDLEHYWLSRNLRGEECDPMEMSAMVEAVTREDILNAAQGIVLDAVYFLKGSDEEPEDEEEEE